MPLRRRDGRRGLTLTWLIHAAEEGCLPCAAELVEKHLIDPRETGQSGWEVTPREAALNGLEGGREECQSIIDMFDRYEAMYVSV